MIAWVRKRPGVAILLALGSLLLLVAGSYAIAQESGLFRTESRGNNTIRYQLTQQLPAGFTGRIEPGDGSLYVIPTDLTNGEYVDHQYDQSVVDALGPNGELTWRVYQDGVVQPIQDEKVTVAQITAPAPTHTSTPIQQSATTTPTHELPSATLTATPSATSTGSTVGPTVTNTALSGTPTGTPTGATDPDPGASQTAVSQTEIAGTSVAGTAIAQTQTAAQPLVFPDTFLPIVLSADAPEPAPSPVPAPTPE